MKKKNYLDQAIHVLEPKYNAINLTFVIVLYLVGISFLFREGFLFTALLDIFMAMIGTIVHVFRHKLVLQKKMLLTLTVLLVFSAQSLVRAGFVGNGLIGLTLIIVISITFLDQGKALFFSLMTILVISTLTVLAYTGIFDLHQLDIARYTAPVDWVYQSISLGLFLMVTYFSIYTIRKMLLDSIEQLSELAYKDQLTGLSNRNYFLEKLPTDKIGDINKKAIIAILDIHKFRLINTFYGVEKGDQLLKSIAKVTSDHQSNQIVLSRIGGNEFALFAIGWDKEDLATYYQKCTDQLLGNTDELSGIPKQRFIIAYKPFIFTKEAYVKSFEDVTIAIKHAKENELQGLVQFEESMFLKYEESEMTRSKIDKALHSDEFHVHFQGKWDIKKQSICGYEALARWDTADGAISPKVFIPLINQSNYMDDFSRMIIQKALSDFEAIQNASPDQLTLSLNISPLFFLEEHFEAFIVEAIRQTQLSSSHIILEITEDVFIEDYDAISLRVDSLKKVGFSISLDDFGSGYSSLNHLNNIDIDELKVDKSIIDGILDNPKSKILYQMVASLASKMGCNLVAEGVETIEQYNCLIEIGCDSIQGYYFSKPQSKEYIIQNYSQN